MSLVFLQKQWGEQGYARLTINSYVCIIRQAFKHGVKFGWVNSSTHYALQAVDSLKSGRTKAPEYQKVKPVSVDSIEKLHTSRGTAMLTDSERGMLGHSWSVSERTKIPAEGAYGTEFGKRGTTSLQTRDDLEIDQLLGIVHIYYSDEALASDPVPATTSTPSTTESRQTAPVPRRGLR